MTDLRIYLVQHGLAVDKAIDPDRPLSEQGIAEVTRMAEHLKMLNICLNEVFHSGKTRARQTAEIYAKHLNCQAISAIDNINPTDNIVSIIKILNNLATNSMVVGHLPFMQRCVSQLLCGHENAPINYLPGSVACLLNNNNNWALEWMLRPELLPEVIEEG